MTKQFTFKDQLIVGDRGEELFLERYPKKLEIYPGREYDFIIKKTGEKVELKTDTYNINKTDNFFFERYSDVSRKTNGGPWRAEVDKVDIFCYYFIRHNIWFQFTELDKLIRYLNEIVNESKLIYVKNKGYCTAGYKVNRKELEKFYDIYSWED